MKKTHMVSGLPRSGSTLLINILAQNPSFHCSKATSGLHDILFGVRNQWDRLVEHQAEGVDYNRLRNVLKAIFESYHDTNKEIIIDKGRGWLTMVEMCEFVFGRSPKIIVPVRNITEVLASFEKLYRKTNGHTQWAFESENYIRAQTCDGRCEIWSGESQLIGLAYNRVKDVIQRGHKEKLLFVEFDNLTIRPAQTFKLIYDYLEEPYFKHDFEQVKQYTKEDDAGVHRIQGLHDIRSKVEPVPHCAEFILGKAVYDRYKNSEIWRS